MPSTYLPVARRAADLPHVQDLTDLLRGSKLRERAGTLVGLAVTIGVLLCVVATAGRLRLSELFISLPTTAGFWGPLAAAYLLVPMLEWVVLRRLWRLPAAGIFPLLRKQAANELLLGYSGDAQFYFWARNAMPTNSAPFATLRDISILSALAGNLATLILMAMAYPTLSLLASGPLLHGAVLATLAIVVSSLGIFAARHAFFRFSLSRRAIAGVFLVHLARIAGVLILNASLWAMLVPGATMATLLVLGTMRMMLSRVPLIPGKEALFAGSALALIGSDAKIVGALATIAGLMIALHAVVGLAATVHDLARRYIR